MSIKLLKTSASDPHGGVANTSSSLLVTYPKTVQITFGNYPYADHIENLKNETRHNLTDELEDVTYVRGKMTPWNHFVDNPVITKFINHCINSHQLTNPGLFRYFYQKQIIQNLWGIELGKGDRVAVHDHLDIHGLLYLTEGNPLILPELQVEITPKAGDYYFFPPGIKHYVEEIKDDNKRYTIVMNIAPNTSDESWAKNKRIRERWNKEDKV